MFSLLEMPILARTIRRVVSVILVALILFVFLPQWAGAEETGVVTATQLFIRKSPSTEAEKLRTLEQGWKVTILGTEGDWYKVQHGETIGYSSKKYIDKKKGGTGSTNSASSSKSATGGKGTIAALGNAPGSCKPGDQNDHVLKVQKALSILGYYSGNQTGNYGKLTEQAVKDFQKAKGLAVDGIAGKGTIQAMFGEQPTAGSTELKTERLNWFHGGNGTIPNNATFTVKDVGTGRTFKARRWSGANHLDAEPCTKEDTATIKKNYGGSFSWSRRPVLVKYNGHVYAGSMNSMPHGTQTIEDNNYEGHFCIHFYQSRTHGSDKVDESHQNAVARAMNASW